MSATQALNNNTLHVRYVGTNDLETMGQSLAPTFRSACPLYNCSAPAHVRFGPIADMANFKPYECKEVSA
jgi:hypothetical protein